MLFRKAVLRALNFPRLRCFTTAQPTAEAKPATEAKVDPRDETIKQLHKQLEETKKQAQEWKKELHYSMAENDSIIRRYKEEIALTKEYAISKFAKDLLEVHDNFHRALQSVSPAQVEKLAKNPEQKKGLYESFVMGVQMTQNIMMKTFGKHGVVEFNPTGEKFNPNLHEAVAEIKDPKKANGVIADVALTGFKIGKRILRAPKVVVVKNTKA